MFGRKSASEESSVAATTPDDRPVAQQGKGRPTPKRRDAEAARKAKTAPPKDRREAKAKLRAENRREREESAAALKAGDARAYPARDRGPARAITRNYVDGRRGAGEFFWPVVIFALLMLVVPVPRIQQFATFVLLGFYVVIVSDSVAMVVGLRRLLNEHAANDPMLKGCLPYAFSRSIQSRRRRLPPAKVKVGYASKMRKGTVDLTGSDG